MDTLEGNQKELQRLAAKDFERYSSLPFPVYVTDAAEGRFIYTNAATKWIFGLNSNEKQPEYIARYYRREKDRDYIMRCLTKTLKESIATGEEVWDTANTLEFKINGIYKSLKLYAKPFGNQNGELLGAISLTFPITEIDKFHKLEDKMSIGIFEVGIDQEVSYANQAFKKLLKISSSDIPYKAVDFFEEEEDFKQLLQLLESNKEEYETGPVVLRKTDGHKMLAQLQLVAHRNKGGKLVKTRGILRDLTNHEIIKKAPVGIYLVMPVNSEDIIVKANKEFARIHEFDDEEDCIGYPIKDLHISPASFSKLSEKLKDIRQNGTPLENYPLEVKTIKGNRRQIRTNIINYRKTGSNETIGRIGIVLDVTKDVDRMLESWKHDFAGFLHSYSNMLISMRDTINSIITGHGTDTFSDRKVDMKRAGKTLESYIRRLPDDLKSLLAEIQSKNISFSDTKIQKLIALMHKKDQVKFREKAVWARQIAVMIRKELSIQLKNQHLHKETLKLVQNDIAEILRYARLISLSIIVDEIPEILTDIDNFKSVLTDSGDVLQSSLNPMNITETLKDVLKSLNEFAQSKRVEIRSHFSDFDQFIISGNSRYLYSAFYNIIHNAIKYSRSNDEFGKRWVDIYVTPISDSFKIEVINLGVPIRKVEIEEGLIKQFGFRGADSMQDGRKGSGIGLWHANKIIDQHNGTITIASNPADQFADAEDYTKWFRTTVSIVIKTNI